MSTDFERFVGDATAGLLRTAYLVVWDLPAAEDLVQECLLQVARRWPRVRRMDHPGAYARRVLLNLALDAGPRRSRHRSELDRRGGAGTDLVDEHADRALGMVDAGPLLVAALAALAPRQRAVLVLRYIDDLTEAQVADALGCSVGTVKSTASRALDRLRRMPALVAERPHPKREEPLP